MNEHPNATLLRTAYAAMEKGDMATTASLLDDDIIWHESSPGFEGTIRGHDQVLAFFAKVFQEAGVRMHDISIHDVLANDDHAVILHETTITVGGKSYRGQYLDVYHVRNGKATEHWHLAVDPKAEEEHWAELGRQVAAG